MIHRAERYDLGGHNTFGMKLSCASYIEYDDPGDLVELDFAALPQPVLHIGAGSNLLFTKDFPGTILHSCIKGFRLDGSAGDDVLVEIGAGIVFDDFCAWAADNELWGPENLSGIPGEVGAAAVQNIGAYGVEAGNIISFVKCFDIQTRDFVVFPVAQCAYAYRDSIFKHQPAKGRYIVTSVLFHLTREYSPKLSYGHLAAELDKEDAITPSKVREVVLRTRDGKLPDPAVLGSAGSFFKNPVVSEADFERICAVAAAEGLGEVPHFPVEVSQARTPEGEAPQTPAAEAPAGERLVKVPAAWMIDKCGLKGLRRGGAAVYERQPLVIVNASGEASPQDVLDVEKAVQDAVQERFGVSLSPEVEHI